MSTTVEDRIKETSISLREEFPHRFDFMCPPNLRGSLKISDKEIFSAKKMKLVSHLSALTGIPEWTVRDVLSNKLKPWNQVIEELSAESLLAMWDQK